MKRVKDVAGIILSATIIGFAGCRHVEEPEKADVKDGKVELEISMAENSGSVDNMLEEYFIEGKSVILISQRGDYLLLNFEDYTASPDDPSVLLPNTNLYKYIYYSNPEANWNQGYNFEPYGSYELNWTEIEKNRLLGEYSFGALYYPGGYTVYNSIETDQSDYNNLLKSNILGAWHKTNAINSRLRFKFYHLMAAARVTLLIPAWNPEDNSGFGEEAIKSATMLKMKKDFTIDWPLSNSTEEAPAPQIPENADTYDLKMYLESVSNTVETINLQDIAPGFGDQEERVRRATFVVLFPAQQPNNDGPAMRFVFNTLGGSERTYVWYSQNIIDSTLTFARGSINNLIIYIPRTENDAILIKSYIEDWIPADSEFAVIPDNDI